MSIMNRNYELLRAGTGSVLENLRTYLSGPIEFDATHHNWRTEPAEILRNRFKIDLYDPFADPKQQFSEELIQARKNRDFPAMQKIAGRFVSKDLSVVQRSDILIAYLPYKVPTTGTHEEIITSNRNKIVTLLVCPQGREFLPLWYYGYIKLKYMFDSWEDLYTYLDEVNNFQHTDDKRWAFAYGLL